MHSALFLLATVKNTMGLAPEPAVKHGIGTARLDGVAVRPAWLAITPQSYAVPEGRFGCVDEGVSGGVRQAGCILTSAISKVARGQLA